MQVVVAVIAHFTRIQMDVSFQVHDPGRTVCHVVFTVCCSVQDRVMHTAYLPVCSVLISISVSYFVVKPDPSDPFEIVIGIAFFSAVLLRMPAV